MNIQVSEKHKTLVVPFRLDLANLFPHAKYFTHSGNDFIALPHGLQETKVLRNLGMEAPAPILSQYDWCGATPFDIQRKTAALLTTETRAYVLNGMGTGKTRAALWAWDFLNKNGMAGKLLIAAPLSTLNFTWAKEVFALMPHRKVGVLHGTKAKRLKRLADPDVDIFVVNHDGLALLADDLGKRSDIDTLVLDELAVFRNGQAQRSKMAAKLAAKMKWVWGMTGSPTPNEPTDAWGQCRIVTPNTIPKYFARFREDLMYKVTTFKWAAKPDAIDKAFAAMQPSVRYTLDDVMELPDLVERTQDVELGPNQKRVYESIKKSAYAAIAAKEITAVNAGAALNKLLQISCGWVYTSDHQTVSLDNDERMTALLDALAATDRKVIVFVPFVHALDGIRERLAKEGYDVEQVSGATPHGKRNEIFTLFQNTNRVKVLVAHPQCMAHGVTLTSADTIIWFAPTTSLEIFEQSNARIRRVGQKHRQLVLMFQSTDAEKRMYKRLRDKQKVQNLLLDMFEEDSQ